MIVRIAVLAVAAFITTGAAPVAAQSHHVMLQVQSQSWVADSGFDEAGFRQRCAEAGVELVPPKTTGAEATAVVRYTEAKGQASACSGSARRSVTARTSPIR